MGSRTLQPSDPEAKRYEDIRKSNLEPGKEWRGTQEADEPESDDDEDTED